MSEQDLTIHKRGRATFEVLPHKWPVITASLLGKATSFEPLTDAENPLVGALTRGYVHLCNCETNLRRARSEAVKKRDEELSRRIEVELERLAQVKEEWPLVVVGL